MRVNGQYTHGRSGHGRARDAVLRTAVRALIASYPARPRFFPRFAGASRETLPETRWPLVYSPARASCSALFKSYVATAPRRRRLELPEHPELAPAWREIRTELRRVVGESTYEIWLAPLEVKAWDGTQLLLQAPATTQTWVAERFGRIVEGCARTVFGDSVRVPFAGDERQAGTVGRRQSAAE